MRGVSCLGWRARGIRDVVGGRFLASFRWDVVVISGGRRSAASMRVAQSADGLIRLPRVAADTVAAASAAAEAGSVAAAVTKRCDGGGKN